ncbi:glutathione S-transferase Mu 1 [Galendromus occidentalis]|uniref:glutathione transferase n=1 Tax=Galendromus occidentalis TaxID=34638 RepID=A0AAJ6W009_9ACAR|nr:glutathione S-transferase Mu 1 [Galendromus occidentalis]
MSSVILGYWDLRGLGQSIRLLLEQVGEKYEETRYTLGNDLQKNEWRTIKTSSPLIIGGPGESRMDFPNLPYYIETKADGSQLKLSQSVAIMRYLGEKHGLIPTSLEERALLTVYEQEVTDLRAAICGYCYGGTFPHKFRFPNYVQDIRDVLKTWDQFLDKKQWIMGDLMTYVDFYLYEMLDWHILLDKTILDAFPNIASYSERIRKLPAIEAYMKSDRYIDWPLVSPLAPVWGSINHSKA